MTEHRAPGRSRLTPRQVRALLALLAVALLTTGLGVRGTFAAWTDSATLVSGSIESGSLDISIDGSLIGAANNGGSVTKSVYGATGIVPGESFAFAFPVKNEGTATFTYAMTSGGTGGLIAPTNGVRLTYYRDSSANGATNNTSASGFRTASCSGTAGNAVTSNSAATVANGRTLASGGTDYFCVLVSMPSGADNTAQSKSATVSIRVAADQLTS